MRKKRIAILATGGTIAAIGEEGKTNNYESGEIAVEDLLGNITGINELADLVGVQVCNIPSTDISFSHWYSLADTINKMSEREDIDGFVIAHGTDTIEETAYFIHLVAKTNKPIVITGSMRPATAISADGPMNLFQAVAVAANSESVGKGVLLVFADCIYSARDVQKVNGFRVDAFSAKDMGAVGYVLYDKVVYYYESVRKHTYKSEIKYDNQTPLPKVNIVYSNVDSSAEVLLQIAKESDGIVLAGTGSGWYSTDWIEATKKINDLQIPIIRSTRVANGFVQDVDCLNCCDNIISGDNLPPSKAKILLQLAIQNGMDYEGIKLYFSQY